MISVVTRDTEKQTLLLAGYKQSHNRSLKEILSVKLRKFAYLFVNDQWKRSRNKGKRVLKST